MKAGLSVGVLALLLYIGILEAFGPKPETASQAAAVAAQPLASPNPLVTPIATSPTARPFTPVPTATPTQAPPTPVPTPLSEELEQFVADLDGTYGVAVHNPRTGERILINADRIFQAASLYKLLVMYRVFQFLDEGRLSPGSRIVLVASDMREAEEGDGLSPGDVITVDDAMEMMITASSNPAAYALTRTAGGWDHVLSAAPELGMKSTEFDGEYVLTTPADMLHFFEQLAARSLVSPEASEEMIAVLLRQQKNDRLPADLPPDTKVAHKTGELPEVRNDGGIVFTRNGPYAIVIMSEGIDPDKALPAQAKMSRMVFDRYGN